MRDYRPPQQPPKFEKRPVKPTLHPRRVVGGVRLQYRPPVSAGGDGTAAKDAQVMREIGTSFSAPNAGASAGTGEVTVSPTAAASGWTWASSRWMRLAEEHALGEQLVEGLEYARLGQARSIEIKPGLIAGKVQGRVPTAYKTELRLPLFTHEQWARIVSMIAEQAKYSAALIGGEIPNNIEDIFAPMGLRLFPSDEQDLATSCNCDVFRGKDSFTGLDRPGGPSRWCKHICCLMYLVAEKLAQQPLTIFSLRGLDGQELLEQLRQQRALAGLARVGGGAAPVYVQHVPNPQELSRPLEELLRERGAAGFWSAGGAEGALEEIDLSIQRPEVTHPLLRRLGASPFKESKFPMVGLLATCYDVVSEAAIKADPSVPNSGDDADAKSEDDGAGE